MKNIAHNLLLILFLSKQIPKDDCFKCIFCPRVNFNYISLSGRFVMKWHYFLRTLISPRSIFKLLHLKVISIFYSCITRSHRSLNSILLDPRLRRLGSEWTMQGLSLSGALSTKLPLHKGVENLHPWYFLGQEICHVFF